DEIVDLGKVNCQPVIDALNEPPKDYDELMAEFVKLRDALESVSINANLTGIGPRKEAQLALDAIPDKYRSK
ncbi:hypothetical protein KAR91_71280, partial [Candidatus Pacearchaeota archaeon]|nr:hypothetical protein [Candidatus Pacearchaeota archaeon]